MIINQTHVLFNKYLSKRFYFIKRLDYFGRILYYIYILINDFGGKFKMEFIKKGQTILFQGDSVTDWGRDRGVYDSLGGGYPIYTAEMMKEKYSNLDLKFLNRGVSGDRLSNVKDRWKEDFIDISPDVLSMLIGINDVWRNYDSGIPSPADKFLADYREILTQAQNKGTEIIIIEPFLLPVEDKWPLWKELLLEKIEVCRKVSKEFDTKYVPMQDIFTQLVNTHPAEYFAADGVHPTEQGAKVIAEKWVEEVMK